jgi:hypothetical protein
VQQAAGREVLPQAAGQIAGALALVRAVGGDGPLGAVHVVDGHEGRLAALGQAHVAGAQVLVHLTAQGEHAGPLMLVVGPGDARVLVDARDGVVEMELDLALAGGTGDRRGAGRLGGAGERNVALAGKQAGCGVQAQPAGARHVHLGPGVQVGEILLGAGRAIQGLDVGRQLHQIAGHEARRQAQVAQYLHQQPAGVATRADAPLQRLLAGLHARLHAHAVGDVPLQALVKVDQKIVDRPFRAIEARQPGVQQRAFFGDQQVRQQLGVQRRRVGEGVFLGVVLDEKIERVDGGQLGDHLHRDAELSRRLGEHQPRQVIAERVLLPVDEVLGRLDAQAVGADRRAAVRRRTQAQHVRVDVHRPIEAVLGVVFQGDADGHDAGVSARRRGREPGRGDGVVDLAQFQLQVVDEAVQRLAVDGPGVGFGQQPTDVGDPVQRCLTARQAAQGGVQFVHAVAHRARELRIAQQEG